MKYFIRKRKDCVSSFCLLGGKTTNGAGHRKTFFLETTACVWCDEWRGSARIGCWEEREVEKMSKTSTLCRKFYREENFEEVK